MEFNDDIGNDIRYKNISCTPLLLIFIVSDRIANDKVWLSPSHSVDLIPIRRHGLNVTGNFTCYNSKQRGLNNNYIKRVL